MSDRANHPARNPARRSRRLRISATLLVVLFAVGLDHAQLALAPNQPVPRLRGRNLEGAHVTVDWSAHRATIVNFWATWCQPCLREMPVLQDLHERRAPDGLAIVGVTTETLEPSVISLHLAKVGVGYPVLIAPTKTRSMWGGLGIMPTSFLIDRDGKLLRRYVGGSEEVVQAMLDDVDALLEGRPLGKPYVPPPSPPEIAEDVPEETDS